MEAALAALLLVTSLALPLLRTCVNADPAALLAALLAVRLRKTFDAADAARFPVTSVFRFVAISMLLALTAAREVRAYFLAQNHRNPTSDLTHKHAHDSLSYMRDVPKPKH
ncbi:hypothetical protein [Roseobacter weihaiensis]|uniref:hypothetical protein n=1 Tax=Roseobacter weihaiensis TaxID=2763262 RepID=UPI001D0AD711|nr:hypothetical protein [Roseobacter sp. H9]